MNDLRDNSSPNLDPNDHRRLASRLDLFHFQDEAPGMVFWHPGGFALYRVLEEAARALQARGGYREVRTPQMLREGIWEASGHLENYESMMFAIEDEHPKALMKPVSCPGHIQIFKKRVSSYRDLPLRYAELGLCHRNERSGVLHGLFRLRQFTQDDGHIFCEPHQVVDEVAAFCRDVVAFYRAFGFERVEVALSTRPDKRVGDDALWDRSEASLRDALDAAGLEYGVHEGEGAFYGPKIEFVLEDRGGRRWQCGTIQLDANMPERFDIGYIDAEGERVRPVMLHRAVFGSLERFMGILLEHHGAILPPPLAPLQLRLVPLKNDDVDLMDYLREVERALLERGVRVDVDARPLSVSKRVSAAHHDGAPIIAVIGMRELEARSLGFSCGREKVAAKPLGEAVEALVGRCALALFEDRV